MKQYILFGLLIGLSLVAPPLQAQTAARDSDVQKSGSRLELGRSSVSRPASKSLRSSYFSIAPPPALSSFDRLGAPRKNTTINEYYRSLLVAPTAAKPAARSVVAESTPSVVSESRAVAEPESKVEERMFANDRISVSNIYPNPASEFAEIDYQINGPVGDARLTLLNILGSPIAEYSLDQNERKIRIQTRELATGYYLYRLSLNGKIVATKKLLVRHQ
ncbi:T9SS C-terminal target domain-containing protein [Fibrisoma montanum]|uniref:T9SS C-terminal target domain-containing protein n=1 Tax=Fibrisoma montanum TaxID=2305895 RepID=A0A418M6U0_9BACT|nr:T9SS type A sorting domain-containing protein [Fibrisoma montanum]RIV21630.1 T9SS C-terminal target domain-containing protein [Fibrisoma montanum]